MKASVLRTIDFRRLFIGQTVSHLGDQFHMIALPWLVLTLTQDPLQLGFVLAVAGVPRAVLMLLGGALADRYSPRTIMLICDVVRFGLAAMLSIIVLTGVTQVWMVYVLALAFGIVSGFFMPAAEATVPRLVEDEQLESANALVMGANQFACFVGPAAAGMLIASFGGELNMTGVTESTASMTGLGVAFAVDALSFLVSGVFLFRMGRIPSVQTGSQSHPLAAIAEGIRYAWGHGRIRLLVILIALANFLVVGPMLVGIPVLAQSRYSGGAATLGILLSAFGLGSLLGMIAAAMTPRPRESAFSWLMVGLLLGFAGTFATLGVIRFTWLAALLMLLTGIGNGYIGILAITSVQRLSDTRYLGRVMALVMLAVVGLVPISESLAGAVMRISPQALFMGAGVGFCALAFFAFVQRNVWCIETNPVMLKQPVAVAAPGMTGADNG